MSANHLKAWRRHRDMTQGALARAIGTTAPVISLLESGDRRLSPKWLRPLAVALSLPVGAVLEYGPGDGLADFLDAWAAVPEAERAQAMGILRTFVPSQAAG
jgi:DNA-binding XRE family transcriptional regulator